MLLDRIGTPLDGAWGSVHGGAPTGAGRRVLAAELVDEIRAGGGGGGGWRHFRPATPVEAPPAAADCPSDAAADRCGADAAVSIYADGDEDQYATFDTETIDAAYTGGRSRALLPHFFSNIFFSKWFLLLCQFSLCPRLFEPNP